MDHCVDCRAVLTVEEKHYYGFSCNNCEIKDMVKLSEEQENDGKTRV